MTLSVDNREKKVFPYLDQYFPNYKLLQLTVGDYHINIGDIIVACIERKTWSDFADSFKDGRYDNKQKMIEFRQQTGNCRLIYLIEGAKPKDGVVHGIPTTNIVAALRKLIIRDDIHVIYTKDLNDTAATLAAFVKDYILEIENKNIQLPTDAEIKVGSSELTTRKALTPLNIKANMLRKLPGISVILSPILAQYTIPDLLNVDKLENITMPNGRKIHNTAITSITKLINHDAHTWSIFLSGISGITLPTAIQLVSSFELIATQLCEITKEDLCNIQLENGKKIGKRAMNVFNIFHE